MIKKTFIEQRDGRLEINSFIESETQDAFLALLKKGKERGFKYITLEFMSSGLTVTLDIHTNEKEWSHPNWPTCNVNIREEIRIY